MHDGNFPISGEIRDIERKQTWDAVNYHGGDQAGIMYSDSSNSVRNQKLPPHVMHRNIVRRQGELAFEEARSSLGFNERQPQATP